MDKDFEKIVVSLQEYANLDGTELGQYCDDLIFLYHNIEMGSDEFKESTEKEIKYQLDNFRTNSVITETEVNLPERKYIEKNLEWG